MSSKLPFNRKLSAALFGAATGAAVSYALTSLSFNHYCGENQQSEHYAVQMAVGSFVGIYGNMS